MLGIVWSGFMSCRKNQLQGRWPDPYGFMKPISWSFGVFQKEFGDPLLWTAYFLVEINAMIVLLLIFHVLFQLKLQPEFYDF